MKQRVVLGIRTKALYAQWKRCQDEYNDNKISTRKVFARLAPVLSRLTMKVESVENIPDELRYIIDDIFEYLLELDVSYMLTKYPELLQFFGDH